MKSYSILAFITTGLLVGPAFAQPAEEAPEESAEESAPEGAPAEPGAAPTEPGDAAAEPGTDPAAAEPPEAEPAEPAPAPEPEPAPEPAPAPAAATETEASASTGATASLKKSSLLSSDDSERSGIYFGFGFGVGGGSLADDAIAGAGGGLFHLRAGWAVTRDVLLGVEMTAFGQYNTWKPRQHVGSTISSLMGQGNYYAAEGISVSGGVGWGSGLKIHRRRNKDNGNARVVADSGNGVSWMAGVGYDVYAGSTLTLTTQARYDGATVGGEVDGGSHTGSLNLLFNFY